jgi:FKBP12-rapamycin complex-associated protein
MWARGAQEETLNHLRVFTAKLAQDIQTETGDQHRPTVSKAKMGELTKLLARCYFKQGEWQATLKDRWTAVSTPDLITSRPRD